MHYELPRPLHGWREFAGEVGVIVLGVLLALGAQQVIQDIQTRKDVRAFRETIGHEIGLDLFVYELRARQFDCDAKHADQLKSWLAHARSGGPVPALWPQAPEIIAPYRSAWDNRDAEVFNRLAPKLRQKYAEFYDELSNNWPLMEGENEQWLRLTSYAESGTVNLDDRRTIRSIIAQIRGDNQALEGNLPLSQKIADVLGVKAARPDNIPDEFLNRAAGCRSAIASPAETAQLNPRA